MAVRAIIGDEHIQAVGGAVPRHTCAEVASVCVVTPAVVSADPPQLTFIFICETGTSHTSKIIKK